MKKSVLTSAFPTQEREPMTKILYCDCPLIDVREIPEKSVQIDEKTVLIFPGGRARATVRIPDEMVGHPVLPHTRSRRARIGMHVARSHETRLAESKTERQYLKISVFNWSWSYGFMLHEGEEITLATSGRIKKLSLATRIPLTADLVLQIKTHLLPKWDGWMAFIDPATMDISAYASTAPCINISLEPHDSLVFQTREQPVTPDGHIGVIVSALPGTQQNAANLDYQGSNGYRAIELRSVLAHPQSISRGMQIATLVLYRASTPLPPYTGEFGKRSSIAVFS